MYVTALMVALSKPRDCALKNPYRQYTPGLRGYSTVVWPGLSMNTQASHLFYLATRPAADYTIL